MRLSFLDSDIQGSKVVETRKCHNVCISWLKMQEIKKKKTANGLEFHSKVYID